MNLSYRIILFMYCFLLLQGKSFLQELPEMEVQNLESVAGELSTETDLFEWADLFEKFRKNPLNLNVAGGGELKEFFFLTDIQINQLISYREVMGELIDLYELQAIPSWDVETIRKLVPYVSTVPNKNTYREIRVRLKNGKHSFMVRVSVKPEKGPELQTDYNNFHGSIPALLFRYNYNHKNNFYVGLTAEKDAGEQFFKGNQKTGFDFYSAHFYLKNAGKVKSLAIGDFTVNMGQGLVQWQGMAFGKNADALSVKRQARLINPYRSAGEYYFFRGGGLTLQQKKFESSLFFSHRRIDSNQFFDSIKQKPIITSFLSSGLHRTNNEIEKKANATQVAVGGNLSYQTRSFAMGINLIQYLFSGEIQKRNEPYNLFALHGTGWQNASIDYSYTKRNFHFFGEFAMDKKRNAAFLQGILLSLDSKADLAILYRHINRAYQAFNGNAFTENTTPTNEYGFYTGLTLRPAMAWRIDMYADVYKFPWLKYSVNFPSMGTEYSILVNYSASKNFTVYSRLRFENKQDKNNSELRAIYTTQIKKQANWRTHIIYKPAPQLIFRARVEAIWLKTNSTENSGYLGFVDFVYKPLMKPYSLSTRLQYFETDGYETRIYAFENDVPGGFSVPSFSGSGYRHYLFFNYDLSENLQFWLKLAAIRLKKPLPEVSIDPKAWHQPELKFQLKWEF